MMFINASLSQLQSALVSDRNLVKAFDLHTLAFSKALVEGSRQDNKESISFEPEQRCAPGKESTAHYGAIVCGGCKIFFARTVTSGKGYVCEKGGKCSITGKYGKRSKCRACRFQMCLLAKMSPHAVGKTREERVNEYIEPVKIEEEEPIVGYYDEADVLNEENLSTNIFNLLHTEPVTAAQYLVNLELSITNQKGMCYAENFSKECDGSMGIDTAFYFAMSITANLPIDYILEQCCDHPLENFRLTWLRCHIEYCAAIEDVALLEESEKFRLVTTSMMPCVLLVMGASMIRVMEKRKETDPKASIRECVAQVTAFSDFAKIAIDKFTVNVFEELLDMNMTKEEFVILKIYTLFNGRGQEENNTILEFRSKYADLLRRFLNATITDEEIRMKRLERILNLFYSLRITSAAYDNWWAEIFSGNVCGLQEKLIYDFSISNIDPTLCQFLKQETNSENEV
ncbi:unnamed protein product [Caenorhabditis bovis]|uniref:Nuclear receptor domain-containing protein n=1 Tax=Caenorhabditis bovis TaxID=2654633 RepID=A0A8S1F801_9PELO|nr:unnamed protein product [Caenorhabditis bovis]